MNIATILTLNVNEDMLQIKMNIFLTENYVVVCEFVYMLNDNVVVECEWILIREQEWNHFKNVNEYGISGGHIWNQPCRPVTT